MLIMVEIELKETVLVEVVHSMVTISSLRLAKENQPLHCQ